MPRKIRLPKDLVDKLNAEGVVQVVNVDMIVANDASQSASKLRSLKTYSNASLGESAARLITLWCEATGRPHPLTEFMFAESIGRRWKFDLAWPSLKVAVEFEGGIYRSEETRHHVSPEGYESDCEKYNTAAVTFGYRVIRVTFRQHTKGDTVRWLEKVIPAGVP